MLVSCIPNATLVLEILIILHRELSVEVLIDNRLVLRNSQQQVEE